MYYLVKQIPENNDLSLSCSLLDGRGKNLRYSGAEAIRLFENMEMVDLRSSTACQFCERVGVSKTLVFVGERGAR